MTANVTLLEGEQLITGGDELLFRQATKHMYDGDQLATTAFGPTSADAGRPSYSRSSVVAPQDARDWHTLNAKTPSLSVWALSVREVIGEGRYAVDDANAPIQGGTERAPGHCFVDFRGLTKPRVRELRAKFYFRAVQRGEIPTVKTAVESQLFGDLD